MKRGQQTALVWASGGSVLLRVDADGNLRAAVDAAAPVPRPPSAPAGPLRCLTAAPASSLVAAATGEVGGAQPSSAVLLWSLAEGGAIAEPPALLSLSAPATALAFSPSASLLAVLDRERWLSVWELAAGDSGDQDPAISTSLISPAARLRADDSFSCLAFATDAKLCAASASRLAVWTLTHAYGTLRVAPAVGKPLSLPPAVSTGRGAVLTGLEAAPGGRWLWATSSNGQLLQLRASGDSYTVASCVQVPIKVKQLTSGVPRITALATGHDLCACACADGSVRLFASPSLELLTSIGSGAPGVHPNSVALGPGDLLSVAYSDGRLASWSLRDPRAPRYLQLPAAAPARASIVDASRAPGSSPSAAAAPESEGRPVPQRLSFGSMSICPPTLTAIPAASEAAAAACAAAAEPAAIRPPNSLEKGFAELEQLAARFRALRPHSPVRASPSLASLLRLGGAGAGVPPDTADAAPLDSGNDACRVDPLEELDAARAGALVRMGDDGMVPAVEEREGAQEQVPPYRPLSASQPAQQHLLCGGSPLAKPLGGSPVGDAAGQAGMTQGSEAAVNELPGAAAGQVFSPTCCMDSPAADVGAMARATPAAWGGLFTEPRGAAVAQALSPPRQLGSISPLEEHAAAELPSRDAFSVFSSGTSKDEGSTSRKLSFSFGLGPVAAGGGENEDEDTPGMGTVTKPAATSALGAAAAGSGGSGRAARPSPVPRLNIYWSSRGTQAACPAVSAQEESTGSASTSSSGVSCAATPADSGGGEESGAVGPESNTDGDSGMFDVPPMHDPLAAESPLPPRAPLPPMLVFDNAAYGHHLATPAGHAPFSLLKAPPGGDIVLLHNPAAARCGRMAGMPTAPSPGTLCMRRMSPLLRQAVGGARPSPLSRDVRAVVGSLAAPVVTQVQPLPERKCQALASRGEAAIAALAGLRQALGALRQVQTASGDSGGGAMDAAFGAELRTLLAELAALPLCAGAVAAASAGGGTLAATPPQGLAATAPAGPAPPTARTHTLKDLVREELLRELRGGLLAQLLAEVEQQRQQQCMGMNWQQ